LLTMQCKRTFTKRFTLSSQKEIAPFYSNSNKKIASLAAIARYIAISYKIDYLQIIKQGTFLQRSKLPWCLTKPQLCIYLPSKTCQHHLETGTRNV